MAKLPTLTDADLARIKKQYEAGKILFMRKPPWLCVHCRERTVNTFRWDAESEQFAVTCDGCGKGIE